MVGITTRIVVDITTKIVVDITTKSRNRLPDEITRGPASDTYSYQNISSSPSRYFNIIIALNLTFKSLYALVQHLIFRARVKNSHFP